MSEAEFKVEALHRRLGGQQVGMTSCAVKVTHIPTGIYAAVETERSQHRNRRIAQSMVEWGLIEIGYKSKPTDTGAQE